jgi:hypothetical protein
MAPTTLKQGQAQEDAPSPEGLVRLTTSGGTEVNPLVEEDSAKPLFIRGASGHFEPQVDLDPEPAKLDIPWPAFFLDKKPRVPSVAHETGDETACHSDELACHKSQCSTEDPNEEATPPLSPRSAPVATLLIDATGVLEWSPGVPTKGSAGHMLGKCKPCAFVFKDGCESGVNCEFCHICTPGEKKRRKKERRSVRHYEREIRATSRKPQFECELEFQDPICEKEYSPPPPPPPMHPWLSRESHAVYEMPMTEHHVLGSKMTEHHVLGSKAWQLAKSEARSRTHADQNSYIPSKQVWYAAYQGW